MTPDRTDSVHLVAGVRACCQGSVDAIDCTTVLELCDQTEQWQQTAAEWRQRCEQLEAQLGDALQRIDTATAVLQGHT